MIPKPKNALPHKKYLYVCSHCRSEYQSNEDEGEEDILCGFCDENAIRKMVIVGWNKTYQYNKDTGKMDKYIGLSPFWDYPE